MSPKTTTPVVLFNTLIQQIFADLGRCDSACSAIKKNRHCGPHHVELDALQASLKSGTASLKSAAAAAAGRSLTVGELGM